MSRFAISSLAFPRLSKFVMERPSTFIFYTFIFIFFLWILYFTVFFFVPEPARWGVFGDAFGALNTLFSGFAFAGVIISLYKQHLDDISQGREFDESIDVLRQSAKAQERQAILSERRLNENTEVLARFFMSREMMNARTKAYYARRAFFQKELDRELFASIWVDAETIDYEEIPHGPRLKYTWPTSKIIDYYCSLYYHCMNIDEPGRADIARRLANRYIWPYWRGYLLTLASLVQKRHEEWVKSKEANPEFDYSQCPLPSWVDDLSKLDRLCGFNKYDIKIHPKDSKSWVD